MTKKKRRRLGPMRLVHHDLRAQTVTLIEGFSRRELKLMVRQVAELQRRFAVGRTYARGTPRRT
jgi:hypothetical protein